MFDKRKLSFWRLAFIFTGLTVITLFMVWSSPKEPKAMMMNDSMGSMMKSMHTSNLTIYDLMNKTQKKQSQMKEMASHHQSQSATVFSLNFLTTAIIFILLPLIIGGAVLLAVVWV